MKNQHSHIHLIGNPEENFYILGRRDKDSYDSLTHQISMLCTRSEKLAKILKITNELSQKGQKIYSKRHMQDLNAYAEGLEKNIKDVLFTFLLPEVVASFNKWVPNLMSIIPGCSSLFIKDPNTNSIIHSRVLDYALSGVFEQNERTLLYDFKDRLKVFSLGSTGVPLPSLTAVNENGLSLALHYKHGRYFDQNGESIFTITDEVISNCSDIREAIKLIKSKRSISYWGIYLSDKNGEIASVDIRGNEIYQEKFDINDHQYLYFNNRPLLSQEDQAGIQPYGNLQQCQSRRDIVKQNLNSFKSNQSKDLMLDGIKLLQKKVTKSKQTHGRNYKLSPTHYSSIQVCSMNANTGEFYYVQDEAPKNFKQGVIGLENILNEPRIKIQTKARKLTELEDSHRLMAKFQTSLDLAEISQAYHYIQMALIKQAGSEEFFITKFYFLITQYIYENDNRDLTYILQDLKLLEKKLPEYLEEHRKLFVIRISKILGHGNDIKTTDFKNPYLRKRYIEESRLNPIGLKALKHLIFPRIEIMDIIYAY